MTNTHSPLYPTNNAHLTVTGSTVPRPTCRRTPQPSPAAVAYHNVTDHCCTPPLSPVSSSRTRDLQLAATRCVGAPSVIHGGPPATGIIAAGSVVACRVHAGVPVGTFVTYGMLGTCGHQKSRGFVTRGSHSLVGRYPYESGYGFS